MSEGYSDYIPKVSELRRPVLSTTFSTDAAGVQHSGEFVDQGRKLYGEVASGQLILATDADHVKDHTEVLRFLPEAFSRLYIIPAEKASDITEAEREKLQQEGKILLIDNGTENKPFGVTMTMSEQVGVQTVVETTDEDVKNGKIFMQKRRRNEPVSSRMVWDKEPTPTNKLTMFFYRRPPSPDRIATHKHGSQEYAYVISTAHAGEKAPREPQAYKPHELQTPAYQHSVDWWSHHAFAAGPQK